jgi:hypothetical protein
MQLRNKRQEEHDWGFTLGQIGQGLRKVYPSPENLPPELSTMLTLYGQIELAKEELTQAQSESRKLVAHIKGLVARVNSSP